MQELYKAPHSKIPVKGRFRSGFVFIFLFIFSFPTSGAMEYNDYMFSSPDDSTSSKSFLKKSALPATLIGLGAVISNSDLEKNLADEVGIATGPDFNFKIDDYMQALPMVQLYVANMVGMEAEHHWFDNTKYSIFSNVLSYSVTHSLKWIFNKPRPDGGGSSWPSGHTTFSFTNAAVLYNEFHNTYPVYAYSGYLFATATGAFRIINKRHWLSDVLAGAGIGMLSTHLIYHFKPFEDFNPFLKKKNITLMPQLGNQGIGIYISMRW